MNPEINYIRFGDVISIKSGNQYIGLRNGMQQNYAELTDYKNALFFCMTPFGFFAEDRELVNFTLRDTPFVLQQLSWLPSRNVPREQCCSDRNKLINSYGVAAYEPMDISNFTELKAECQLYSIRDKKPVSNPVYGEIYHLVIGRGLLSQDKSLFLNVGGDNPLEVVFEWNASIEPGRNTTNNFRTQVYNIPFASPGMCASYSGCGMRL